ncbi:uncharacterized protein LOC124798714 isoform X1 [Schistocerca piceifrons]|uniref:uncharacterized protein LOC124798714 isoform X1 n=1 Tax=Schistocerca piceifrons TaxID=274613 RepID=UPI001F5FF09A|nr:uncharacterized protein LOC124798714 isoform X1 [Schistocerca piceifrons]XP_047118189.1 uncharacterized protein LOC124798714 isoform X1 [Schistocerca piceifrons]
MSSVAVHDGLECAVAPDQITKLFPKCRPRDINLNPVSTASAGFQQQDDSNDNMLLVMDTAGAVTDSHQERCSATLPEDSATGNGTVDGVNGISVPLHVVTSGGSAGGSRTGSASPSGGSHSGSVSGSHSGSVSRSGSASEDGDGEADGPMTPAAPNANGTGAYRLRDSRIIEIAGGREVFSHSRRRQRGSGGVWELRHPVRNGRSTVPSVDGDDGDMTETVFSSEVRRVRHSPAEVVVFDDIGESWQEQVDNTGPTLHYFQSPSLTTGGEVDITERDGGNRSPVGARVIGGLPIAQYEGSPRRYGPRQSSVSRHGTHSVSLPSAQSLLNSPSVYPPRPGFPQRILTSQQQQASSQQPQQQQSPQQHQQDEQETETGSSGGDGTGTGAFDYLYEFSETRKVLEEFFKCPPENSVNHTQQQQQAASDSFRELEYELRRQAAGSAYVGQRLAKERPDQEDSPRRPMGGGSGGGLLGSQADLSAAGSGSTEDLGDTEVGLQVGHSRNFTLSPETTDCDSNCGDLDSELSLTPAPETIVGQGLDSSGEGPCSSIPLPRPAMPVLEDGLSSGHASDADSGTGPGGRHGPSPSPSGRLLPGSAVATAITSPQMQATPPPPAPQPHRSIAVPGDATSASTSTGSASGSSGGSATSASSVEAAIRDIRLALQRTKTLTPPDPVPDGPDRSPSPVWVPRSRNGNGTSDRLRGADEPDGDGAEEGDEEADTDLETDRLLGQQRTDDHGFFDDGTTWRGAKSRTVGAGNKTAPSRTTVAPPVAAVSPPSPGESSSSTVTPAGATRGDTQATTTSRSRKDKESSKKKSRNKEAMVHEPAVLIEGVLFRANYLGSTQLVCEGQPTKTTRMNQAEEAVSRIKELQHHHQHRHHTAGCRGTPTPPPGPPESSLPPPPATPPDPGPCSSVFRLQFLGSVEVLEESGRRRRRRLKKHMVEEAVTRIKALAPEGETQPSTEVDLFISTEKIMVLNTDLKEIMMDHALRTISYIADIGDLVVLMARRRFVPHEVDEPPKINRTPKMICHVFESEEAQFIAQSIGQAFQVAYMEFLKANGIEDHSFVKEMDYQEVLNSQEIFGDELQMFAKKEMQKEVVVPKAKGEILGVVIVESGWGSMLPTVVIANLAPAGAAARCGQLNIGDQIIAINGVSLVGLPLSTCQTYIKNTKNQTVVKLTVVPCAPVVEVKIKRPDTKYQLGFSVQNGVICSLLRGGIAERGGVRVGHRIIEINNQSVVAVPHEKIVNLLATSVGEILMKTMPTSMFRLLTGQETPVYI